MKKEAKLKPAGDYVLLKREPAETVLSSGIIVKTHTDDDGGARKLRRGEVLAVGPGRWDSTGEARLPMPVKPGDVVLFSPVFSGMESKKTLDSSLKAEQLILLSSDIWAVEERES